MELVCIDNLLNIESFVNKELWPTVKYFMGQNYNIPTIVALTTSKSNITGDFSCKIDSVFNVLVRSNFSSRILNQEKFLFTLVDFQTNFYSSRLVIQELITKFDADLLTIAMLSSCYDSRLPYGIAIYVQTRSTIAVSYNQIYKYNGKIIVSESINPLQRNSLNPALYFTFPG